MTRLLIASLLLMPALLTAADGRARNVVLFLADAGGIPTINAASLHGYGAPRKLFLQRMASGDRESAHCRRPGSRHAGA
jgi:alkaline phosphatase